jgi:predicted nuclease of restriction endonuclease-like (RecB) superfamily
MAATAGGYASLSGGIAALLEAARHQAVRAVNTVLTATYWEIGRRIVEFRQAGEARADYGDELLERLANDLTRKFGKGFSKSSLFQMRAFYLTHAHIFQTVSGKSRATLPPPIFQTPSGKSSRPPASGLPVHLEALSGAFPLSWSHYVRLLSVESPEARHFYEEEARRGGWSVRQLDRQISTLFYERTALARNKAKALTAGTKARREDTVSVEEEIKNPLVLEFLGLRDDYAENELEDALVRHLEAFLLELGNDFTFVARQKRIRIGKEWYRMDLLLFHRRLRCLVIFDLKVGRFTHADAGQMNLYVNYAGEHLTLPDENPPVGLILCSEPDDTVARYALNGLTNKVLATQYRLNLPDPHLLEAEIGKTRRLLESPVRRLARRNR